MTIPLAASGPPSIALIAAMTPSRAIGVANRLPWHLPPDLKRFQTLTMGATIVMGRKTFDSIGRPLPGRRNVVVSRTMQPTSGIEVACSLAEALGQRYATPNRPTFVIGGAQIYAQALSDFRDRISVMYLTLVHLNIPDGDAWFPPWDDTFWSCVHCEKGIAKTDPPIQFEYQDWTPRPK